MSQYADGRPLTPFEFLHHDLTHSINRYRDKTILKKEQIFISYLNDDKNLKKYNLLKTRHVHLYFYMKNKYFDLLDLL